jgi:[protein-PII] uridylyltransferase
VVENFAKIVENQTALNALTCLTIADICATNETLWNDWKRTLFGQLYKFTLHQLDASLDYHQISVQHRNEALDLIKFTLNQAERKQLRDFWADCPDNYFLRNTPKQLVWHALACFQQPLPIVLVSNEYARGQTEIFVHCQDQPQLFSRIAHTLSKRKVNIYDAQIITGESGKVLDSFIVSDSYGKALSEMRCQQIQQALIKELTAPSHSLKNTLQPIKHPDFRKPTLVRFLPDSAWQTVFELFTPDREGLLAQISQIFNEFGFNLINAKITTIGERVEDLFMICNGNNQALSETEKAALKEKMLEELER